MLGLFKKAVVAIKKLVSAVVRYSEKNRFKAMVQQCVPPEYQTEAMAKLMNTLDVSRPEKIRKVGEIFGDIQARITRDMDHKLEVSRRNEQFERGVALVSRLPEEFRQTAIDGLTEILDLPKAERKERLTRIFQEIQSAIERRFDGELASVRHHYSALMRKMQQRFLSPECPHVEFSICYEKLHKKTMATFARSNLQREYANLLRPNWLLLVSAILGITFSMVGTYLTFAAQLGDWVAGNEVASVAANAVLSLAFNALEMSALFMLLSFLPQKFALGAARMIGIAGSLLLVISVVLIILQRTDIGTSLADTAVQSMGRVE